ncbi:hypothetical protein Aab01nite_63360 [Paractinoplanes abujensis]|uniref:DUF2256 domain-containing protein n=1 Tax=Paractinoplanes abujensis TaxID=882441 RepID=A0A7W7G241_9ACTN|nr:DUF2256 domain-containing protein [Actinoplanes abujensis]MBB4692755.1 hypothetical protein [Actinoplanes abujensis]GID22746.1 hypothetical protein Aab01nite_63360 [Actinoplanes abujensis]
MAPPESKTCASCGRTITWRKAWAADWDNVRWCSSACRRRGLRDGDRELEVRILAASERKRRFPLTDIDGEREDVRRAARRLAAAGRVRWLQNGRPVDPSTARGDVDISKL